MENITVVISRGQKVVKAFEYQTAEEPREIDKEMEGVSFPMNGLYEGCNGAIVGVL